MLQLERVAYPQISVLVDLQGNGSIEIENNYSLNVSYDAAAQKCISSFSVHSVCNAHPDWFDISVTVRGVFSSNQDINLDDNLNEIRAESYDYLFPYAQALVSDLTAKAGSAPYLLKKTPMNSDK